MASTTGPWKEVFSTLDRFTDDPLLTYAERKKREENTGTFDQNFSAGFDSEVPVTEKMKGGKTGASNPGKEGTAAGKAAAGLAAQQGKTNDSILPLEEEKKRKAEKQTEAEKLDQILWGGEKQKGTDLDLEFKIGFDSAGYGGKTEAHRPPSYLKNDRARLEEISGMDALERFGEDNRAQVSLESTVPRYTISAPFWKEKPTDDPITKKAREDAEKLVDDLYRDSKTIPSNYGNNLGSYSLGKEYDKKVNQSEVVNSLKYFAGNLLESTGALKGKYPFENKPADKLKNSPYKKESETSLDWDSISKKDPVFALVTNFINQYGSNPDLTHDALGLLSIISMTLHDTKEGLFHSQKPSQSSIDQQDYIQNSDYRFLLTDPRYRDRAVSDLEYLRDHLTDYLPQNEYYTGEETKRYNQEAINKLNRLIEMIQNNDTYYNHAISEAEAAKTK